MDDGLWQIKKGTTVPKLKGRMDAGTKIANPEIMDEGFQPIEKEYSLGVTRFCAQVKHKNQPLNISLLVPHVYNFAVACLQIRLNSEAQITRGKTSCSKSVPRQTAAWE